MYNTMSDNVPPYFSYRSITFIKRRPTISWSGFSWPGASRALYFHWAQRDELVNDPDFSAKLAAGSRNTSVLTSSVFLPARARISGFQNEDVSVSKFSATTSHFSCDRAKTIFRELGPLQPGFIQKSTSPST